MKKEVKFIVIDENVYKLKYNEEEIFIENNMLDASKIYQCIYSDLKQDDLPVNVTLKCTDSLEGKNKIIFKQVNEFFKAIDTEINKIVLLPSSCTEKVDELSLSFSEKDK